MLKGFKRYAPVLVGVASGVIANFLFSNPLLGLVFLAGIILILIVNY